MSLPRVFNPFRQADALGLLDPDFFRGLAPPLPRSYEKTLAMHLDVVDEGSAYRVVVDVPGVKKENLDVRIEGNQLSIGAEVRREEPAAKEAKELYSERFEGRSFRTITLPEAVDADKAKALYDGGVLRITLPKRAGREGARIAVA
jgi:HSP20 family protein